MDKLLNFRRTNIVLGIPNSLYHVQLHRLQCFTLSRLSVILLFRRYATITLKCNCIVEYSYNVARDSITVQLHKQIYITHFTQVPSTFKTPIDAIVSCCPMVFLKFHSCKRRMPCNLTSDNNEFMYFVLEVRGKQVHSSVTRKYEV